MMKKTITIISIMIASMATMAQVQPIGFDNAPTLNSNDVFIIQRVSDGKVYKLDWGTLRATVDPYSYIIEGDNSGTLKNTASGDGNLALGYNGQIIGTSSHSSVLSTYNSIIDDCNYSNAIAGQDNYMYLVDNGVIIGGEDHVLQGDLYLSVPNKSRFSAIIGGENDTIYRAKSSFIAASQNVSIYTESVTDGVGTSIISSNSVNRINRNYTLHTDNLRSTYTTYPGDTTAGSTYAYYAGQLSNNDNDELMQHNGTSWRRFIAENDDSVYIRKATAQFHRVAALEAGVINSWIKIPYDLQNADESTYGFEFNADSTGIIYTGQDGIIRLQGCAHVEATGTGTESIYFRGLVNGVEQRCTQATETKSNQSGDHSTVPITGTIFANNGDEIIFEFQVSATTLIMRGDTTFDNPVSFSMNFEYMSKQ